MADKKTPPKPQKGPKGPTLLTVSAADAGIRLDKWLKKNHPIPISLMQKLLRKGAIRVDGKRAKADMALSAGAQVKLPSVEQGAAPQRAVHNVSGKIIQKHITDRILYDDNYFLAINKLPDMAVQGGTKVSMSIDVMLKSMEKDGKPGEYRLTHRLDKDTSGVLLIAKTRASAEHATKAFKAREFGKIYWAVVMGFPTTKEGTIKLKLAEAGSDGRQEKTVPDEENGKFAITNYRVLETAGRKFAWVEVHPETGRKHQIRAHFAAIGHPIVGDYKYGGEACFVEGLAAELHLHARELNHPDLLGKKGRIEAPLSTHMKATWEMMGWEKEGKSH